MVWYASSVAYSAVSQFAASHAYSIGDIIRQRGNSATQTISSLTSVTTTATATVTGHGFITGQSVLISGAVQTNYNKQTTITVVDANTFTYTITATTSPATGSPVVFDSQVLTSLRCFRCTTAGTSAATEPAWALTKGSTTTSSGATFTEVTGNSLYNWSAPFPTISFFNTSWTSGPDTLYISSDHAETFPSTYTFTCNITGTLISVSRAGSVPPVAADILAGASVTTTGASPMTITASTAGLFQGITFNCGTGNNLAALTLAVTNGSAYFKNCNFNLIGTNGGSNIVPTSASSFTVWDNCTVQFGNVSQGIVAASGTFLWLNTPNAIQGATIPTVLLGNSSISTFTLQGVDLSAMTSGTINGNTIAPGTINLFDCKLASGVTISATPSNVFSGVVDLKNCDSGANGYRNEYYGPFFAQTTETAITRTGGSSDGVQLVSWKCVTSGVPPSTGSFLSPIYKWNTTLSSVTATIEVFSNVQLNNNDIWIEVLYLGSSGSPQGSTVSSGLATPLTASAAITSSTAKWANMFFNPADETNMTLSNGNLTATKSSTSPGGVRSFTYTSSGLLYYEVTNVTTSTTWRCGLSPASYTTSAILGGSGNTSLAYIPNTGVISINLSTIATIQTATTGDVIGFAVDFTHSKIWIRKNGGNWNNDVIGNQNPATNTGGASISTMGTGPFYVTFADASNGTASATVNFGDTSFNAAAPAGFSAWNTVTGGQKMQVTFTPAKIGYVRAFVKVAKANATIYIDPLITIA